MDEREREREKRNKKKIIHREFSDTPVSRKYELQWNECIVAMKVNDSPFEPDLIWQP